MKTDRDVRGTVAPAGFTLVELLVVIAILALLAGLLVPAVMRARASAYNAKVKSEIDMLHMALMNYKNEYGSFPPARMKGLWNASTRRVNTGHEVYRHLVRLFPRMAENKTDNERGALTGESPFKYMDEMSPAQALVFWLQGFYPNQEYPLTNGQGWPPSGSRRRFFEFEEVRLYGAGPWTDAGTQEFVRRADLRADDPRRLFPVYFTAHANAGLPYVYFDARCYDNANVDDTSYGARSLQTGEASRAFPYFNSDPPLKPLWSQRHVGPETFQLIAAGADGAYGAVAAAFPRAVVIPEKSNRTIPAVTDVAAARAHQDNITNFAGGPLLEAAKSLENR